MALGKSLEVRLFLKVLLKLAVAVGQWLQSGVSREDGGEGGGERAHVRRNRGPSPQKQCES